MKNYYLIPQFIVEQIAPDDPFFDAYREQFRVIEQATGACHGEPFDSTEAAWKFIEQLQSEANADAENAARVERVSEYPDTRQWIDHQADQGRPVAWFADNYFFNF